MRKTDPVASSSRSSTDHYVVDEPLRHRFTALRPMKAENYAQAAYFWPVTRLRLVKMG